MASIPSPSSTKGFYLDENLLEDEIGKTLSSDRDIDWSAFLETMNSNAAQIIQGITRHTIDAHPRKEAFQLFNVLTPEECQFLIDATEKIGYQELQGYDANYRSNTRRIIYYSALQDAIWDRTKQFMTATVPHKAQPRTWTVKGLNPQFRFCRYTPGQKFAPHYDGGLIVDETEQARFTFMIYLNGGFEGGSTNFLSDHTTPGPQGTLLVSLPPTAGMLLVFEQNIYHEGEALRSGVKYMMRSDLMYKLGPIEEKPKTKKISQSKPSESSQQE